MISLRRTMEQQREELLQSALDCCRSVVNAFAEGGVRVCPPVADTFQQNLLLLSQRLAAASSAPEFSSTEREIGREIEGWSSRAAEYYRRKATEIRDVMLAMNEAAKAVAERDERYHSQFTEVTTKLREIDDLEDLSRIRQIVQSSAGQLRSSVDRMVEEGRESVARLKAQVQVYEQRLEEAERASCTDSLTGLLNRCGIERDIVARIQRAAPFSLVVADLNGFKKINDSYGHAVGDELLKTFAREFRSQFRALDSVGRWGGDEFVVLLDCPVAEARNRIEAVRRWVLGDYPLVKGGRVNVSAAIGMAEWRAPQTAEELFREADQAMYKDKNGAR